MTIREMIDALEALAADFGDAVRVEDGQGIEITTATEMNVGDGEFVVVVE